jgi:DNA-binding NarL/FixJ family response regulator
MRILLADSQVKVRFALRVLLERQPGVEVIGEAASAEELLARAAALCPDLVLLDWTVAGAVAPRIVRALRRDCPDVEVIALSGRPEMRGAALAAGVDAFVSKGNPPEHLLAAIARCCQNGKVGAGNRTKFRDALAAVPPIVEE